MKRIITVFLAVFWLFGAEGSDSLYNAVQRYVQKTMRTARIPGVSIVYIHQAQTRIHSFGWANREQNIPVTPQTLFELASCSKAFTALAIQKLAGEQKLSLNDPASRYIPWFKPTYKKQPAVISIRHLLHHTSGIPWSSMSNIPVSDANDALEKTIRTLEQVKLKHKPGSEFEYATINYDVLAYIIQVVTGTGFEEYLATNILAPLGMRNSRVGRGTAHTEMATGYKNGFFATRPYNAPVYRGNNAGGYIISNAEDMARWLQFQLNMLPSPLNVYLPLTHRRDETVMPHDLSYYGFGWEASLKGNGEITHSGLNPNFTAFVGFRPETGTGVVVLANSNSGYTPIIGQNMLRLLSGEQPEEDFLVPDGNDKGYSIITCLLLFFIAITLVYLFMVLRNIASGKRKYTGWKNVRAGSLAASLLLVAPVAWGIYMFPNATAGFSWAAALVWSPPSFVYMLIALAVAVFLVYVVSVLAMLYPSASEFRNMAPRILLLSLVSGLANMLIILLATSSVNSSMKWYYIAYYFLVNLAVYLFARRFVQVSLVHFTNNLVYRLRLKLLNKIFSTSYQQFEQMDRGRVYTALNDDVETLGNSANMGVMLAISLFTVAGAFFYLAAIAFWVTVLTCSLIIVLAMLYYFVARSTNIYFEQARDTRNHFIGLLNGLVGGFAEISLRKARRTGYMKDIADSANEYRQHTTGANIRFVNAAIIGELALMLLLGMVSFGIRELFPQVRVATIMGFLLVLLYLVGPINTILGAVPSVMRMRVAYNRVQQFMAEIPANVPPESLADITVPQQVERLTAADVSFRYPDTESDHGFTVGPVNLDICRGEILFITGGNGSGKTTLSKLLTGLYEPDTGRILVNGREIFHGRIGEYCSTVFNPFYLFEKIYGLEAEPVKEDIAGYLHMLHLHDKVSIEQNRFSTLKLSGGQRKRLALLQCYLEKAPILLFDEWAADQDPEYRHFFYRKLLPGMRNAGKIIIVISHDEQYFDVADKMVKMKNGKMEILRENETAAQ